MIELMTSAPITITFLCTPLSTSFAPTCSAYGNPEHAADRSNPHALFAPSRSCTRQAVAGKNISGVTVATMITSISLPSIPRFARHTFAASTARSLVATPSSTICRSRIPVRSVIHWSLVATIFSRSALVNNRGGTYVPTELIFARTCVRGFNVKLKLAPHLGYKPNQIAPMNGRSSIAVHSLRERHACHLPAHWQLGTGNAKHACRGDESAGGNMCTGRPTAPIITRYRCFLPDLAGLAGLRRVGPGTGTILPLHTLLRSHRANCVRAKLAHAVLYN